MEYFKSEKTKIGVKTYLILAMSLAVYFLAGGYGLMLFPQNLSFFIVGVGILISLPIAIYYLKANSK